jgi:hypothetical protein
LAGLSLKVIGAIGMASYALAYLCTRARHLAYYRFEIVVVDAKGLPGLPRGYSWRVLDRQELAAHSIDVDAEAQRARFADGLQCLVTFDRSGALAGVSWMGKRSHEDPQYGVRYMLPANAAWDTGLWVPEDKRMTRAFSAVWASIGEWLAAEGLDCTISSIADYNAASIASHRRLGARRLRTITVLRLGSLQLTLGAWPWLRWHGRTDPPTVQFRLTAPAAAL